MIYVLLSGELRILYVARIRYCCKRNLNSGFWQDLRRELGASIFPSELAITQLFYGFTSQFKVDTSKRLLRHGKLVPRLLANSLARTGTLFKLGIVKATVTTATIIVAI